jgi:hypothetical protein
VLHNALRLDDSEIREVSPGLLNSFPLVDPITPIGIPGVGEPTGSLQATERVGAILRTVDSRGEQLYVVLREGLQPISAATADIIRYGNPRMPTTSEPTNVSPAVLSAARIIRTLPVDHYPASSPRFVRPEADAVVCMSWQRDSSATEASSRLLIGHRLPLPADAQPVCLATAGDDGPGLDGVYLKPRDRRVRAVHR